MAMNDATTTIVGNLTRDPKLSFTASGLAVCEIGVAVSNRKKEGNEWIDGPGQFFDFTIWDQMGENVAESLAKGNRVIVFGRPDFRQWEDKKTGDNRSKVGFIANAIGPDLKWATAEVQRTERQTPEDRAPSRPAFDPDEEPF